MAKSKRAAAKPATKKRSNPRTRKPGSGNHSGEVAVLPVREPVSAPVMPLPGSEKCSPRDMPAAHWMAPSSWRVTAGSPYAAAVPPRAV